MTKQSMPAACWEQFSRSREAGTLTPPDTDTAEELVWRAVSAGTGKDLLDWLRAETIEKRDPERATEAQLRESEAKRNLVHRLEMMRDRGAEIAAARQKAKT